ncbi:MAG: hypothetical protein JNN15_07725 [Blastocatellia bacterium]|nr:hypothetical protein [Blastocatellia bacterium]
MCVQTVSLIQAAIEKVGISTVSISLLREVTEVLLPPRALFVPFKMGFPLGEANNKELQKRVLLQMFSLFEKAEIPVLEDFKP